MNSKRCWRSLCSKTGCWRPYAKKIVSPAHRRVAAQHAVAAGLCSQRQACRFLQRARSTSRYQGRPPTDAEQQGRKRLRELSVAHPRYGYRRIAAWLHQEGWRVGKRHVQRLRREEGLSVFHPQNARSAAEGFQRGCRRKPLTGTTCGRGILSPMPLCAAGRCGF